MTLHPRPASPGQPTNVETDHPRAPASAGVLTHPLLSCGTSLPSNAGGPDNISGPGPGTGTFRGGFSAMGPIRFPRPHRIRPEG